MLTFKKNNIMQFKHILCFFSILVCISACDTDLDQFPENQAESSSLTNFIGVVNAAYYYQQASATPLAVMGDFRADNAQMIEPPYTDFEEFNSNLTSMEDQFFRPLYRNLYKAILSANTVIENSEDTKSIGEAKFLRALSYFKLVQVFGDVSINLSASPSAEDEFPRQPAENIYNDIIIPDLTDAVGLLDNSEIGAGRASSLAANALLGKVHMFTGDYSSASSHLNMVISEAGGVGVVLDCTFANVVTSQSTETIFKTIKGTDISDEYDFSEFSVWFDGTEDKAIPPIDPDLVAAFDEAGDTERKALSINAEDLIGVKYSEGLESDWIEIRLSDVILLYAEALNETGSSADDVLGLLDAIRTRAGLGSLVGTASSQSEVRKAILDERRLELAMEGHRWFDLVRNGMVDAEMGQSISADYYVFPIPNSEILASGMVITQNSGY